MEEKTTSVFRIYIDQLEKVFVTGEEFEKILQDIMQKYQEKGLFIRYRVKDKEENEYIYGEIAPNNRRTDIGLRHFCGKMKRLLV